MEVTKITDDADPNRCQTVMATKGQCRNVATFNGQCPAHGGVDRTDHTRTYALTKYRARLDHFADDPHIKKLNEEIGILRMMLEMTLNKITDDFGLVTQASTISDLVTKIQACVTAADKLDQRHGQLLDKSVLLKFAAAVVDIISDELGDDPRVENVADRIMETLGDEQNKG